MPKAVKPIGVRLQRQLFQRFMAGEGVVDMADELGRDTGEVEQAIRQSIEEESDGTRKQD